MQLIILGRLGPVFWDAGVAVPSLLLQWRDIADFPSPVPQSLSRVVFTLADSFEGVRVSAQWSATGRDFWSHVGIRTSSLNPES